ncbi:MAG: ABC transporter permease [Verrucomicrobia bacterium]|nr:ABC transporter permease [Verrucomicrobiota bacterium]
MILSLASLLSCGSFSTVQLGVKSLLLHKLRSGLTMLGIIFGVCSVIAMLAIGEGASYKAQEEIKQLGAENIILRSLKPPDKQDEITTAGRSFEIAYGLKYEDGARLQATLPGVRRVLPTRLIRDSARFGQNQAACQVIGTLPFYPEIVPLDILAGRFLAEIDERHQANVCVITASLAQKLFPYQNPLQHSIKLGGVYYSVVGIVRETNLPEQRAQAGDVRGETLDQFVYLPLSTTRSRFGETIVRGQFPSLQFERVELHEIKIRMRDTAAVEAADPQVRTLLDKFHDEDDYEVIVPLQLLRKAEQVKRIFNMVLGSIAAISLLVGGIGIMNIMLANVTERTCEIGIRRALGARKRDITTQFLVETVVLSIGGGLIGVLVGVLIPFLVSQLTDYVTIVTFWSIAIAFGISGAVGIIFGLYPASTAAALDPIEALRHE